MSDWINEFLWGGNVGDRSQYLNEQLTIKIHAVTAVGELSGLKFTKGASSESKYFLGEIKEG